MKKILTILLFFISISALAQNGKSKWGMYVFEDTIYFKNVPYNSGAGVVHLGIDTVAGSPTFGKLVRKTAGGVGGSALSAITASVADNTINNADNFSVWQWNTLSGKSAITFSSNSTAAASDLQNLVAVDLSGANANSGQATSAMGITNRHTGTGSENYALILNAFDGDTKNIGLWVETGKVQIDDLAYNSGASMVGVVVDTLTGTLYRKTSSGGGITIGATTITSGTNTRVLYNNAGVAGEYTISGTGNVAMTTSATLTTPIIADGGFISDVNGNQLLIFDNVASAVNEITISNAATGAFPTLSALGDDLNVNMGFALKGAGKFLFTATSDGPAEVRIFEDSDNGTNFVGIIGQASLGGNVTVTLPNASSTLPIFGQQITFTGPSTARTVTFPDANFTAARTDAAQTFTGSQTFSQVLTTNNAITASGNAATVPITSAISTVTNNSAATLTITLTTTSAIDGQMVTVRVLDFSAVAQTIAWVNTENSSVSVPTTSNGSTTLFLTVRFIYNSATSKWRCIGYA